MASVSGLIAGYIKAQAFSILDSFFWLKDSWFLTRWVLELTKTICNKISLFLVQALKSFC